MIWDFSAILAILSLISGGIWLVDYLFFAKERLSIQKENLEEAKDPILVDYAKSFFPIFLIVLLLRSFLVEPFRIPSGSMIPTLLVGDFILVNKFEYGLRLPLFNKKIFDVRKPELGDVVVFRFPLDPTTPFIKRIAGLPGDKIVYSGKKLLINDIPIKQKDLGSFMGVRSATKHTGDMLLSEELGIEPHQIIRTRNSYGFSGEYEVPQGYYFVLGDNRDNSRDSRFWGFVPEENLIGKAFYIWLNWDGKPNLSRSGTQIK